MKRPHIILLLQGGGARSSFQIGVYRALHEYGLLPDRVAGISSGAINAALIAGNRPQDRLAKMRELWRDISLPYWDMAKWLPEHSIARLNWESGCAALSYFGQRNFYHPHSFPWFAYPPGTSGAMSLYSQDPLLRTLSRTVNFDYLNTEAAIGLSLGCTDAERGSLAFFNNKLETIDGHHVAASGAMPLGAAGYEISREGATNLYWDGGLVANTPGVALLDDLHLPDDVPVWIIAVDLFSRNGPRPRQILESAWRKMLITYADKVALEVDNFVAGYGSQHLRDRAKVTMYRVVYEGSVAIPPYDPMDFGPHAIKVREHLGYRCATNMLETLAADDLMEDAVYVFGGQGLIESIPPTA
jgi:NTE family protein